jgi:hypothetical protein
MSATNTVWCEECDEVCAVVICSAIDERTCSACHKWVECPCQDEDYWFSHLAEIAATWNGQPVTNAEAMWV